MTKRAKAEYSLTAFFDPNYKDKATQVEIFGERHMSTGSYRYYGQKENMEFAYPRLEGAAITLRGTVAEAEFRGITGQIQLASEVKQFPGGNRLHIRLSESGRSSQRAFNFSAEGHAKLYLDADRVVIDDRLFRNVDKYATPLKVLAGVIAFLGLAKSADLLHVYSFVKQQLGSYLLRRKK